MKKYSPGQNMGLKLLSKEYVNAKTKLNWRCSKCDNVFWRPGTDTHPVVVKTAGR